RSLGDFQRLEQQQLTAVLFQAVADLHDPAVTLLRRLVARNETRLLQARDGSAPPMLLGPGREILVEEAVHEQAPGAAAAQLHRAARVHLEQPAVAIRYTGEAVVDPGEFGRGVGQALDARECRRTGAHVHRPAREVAHRFLAVERRAV